jgi:IMS family HHH motif
MRDLPIRKIPGVGRVSERLLDSIGVKVRCVSHYRRFVIRSFCPFDTFSDMWRHLQIPWSVVVTGQTIWLALNAPSTFGHRI